MSKITVSWFSAGVSSAVATKLAIDEIDEIIYTHIDDQHPDTLRFVKECEAWFGKPITILQAPVKTVEAAMCLFPSRGFGRWSPCTQILKRRVRQAWERDHKSSDLVYFWGMDASEKGRAERLSLSMPKQDHRCPLVERGIGKAEAHEILRASGIKRPAMYDLGYHNNNCIGCVKGGAGYWNKIRVDFPEVFAARAKLERKLGGHFLKRGYLDELDPSAGRHAGPICDDCGIMCELQSLNNANAEAHGRRSRTVQPLVGHSESGGRK